MRHAGVARQVGEEETRHWECVVPVACAETGLLNVESDKCMPVNETKLAQRLGQEIVRLRSCSTTARRVAPSHPSFMHMRDRLAGGHACRMQCAEGGLPGRPRDTGKATRCRGGRAKALQFFAWTVSWRLSEMGASEVSGGIRRASRRARPRHSGEHGDSGRSGGSSPASVAASGN